MHSRYTFARLTFLFFFLVKILIINIFITELDGKLLVINNIDCSESNKLDVFSKKFYYMNDNDESSIFSLSNTCWKPYAENRSNYKYDGLIYTPMYLPAGYSKTKNKNYFSSLTRYRGNSVIFNVLPGKTWNLNYKWKPPQENSIDFLVITDKKSIIKKKLL